MWELFEQESTQWIKIMTFLGESKRNRPLWNSDRLVSEKKEKINIPGSLDYIHSALNEHRLIDLGA